MFHKYFKDMDDLKNEYFFNISLFRAINNLKNYNYK